MLRTSRAAILLPFPHRYLTLQGHRFQVSGVDVNRADRVLPGLSKISTLQKDSTQQDMSINHLRWRVPKDRGLQRRDRGLLIATALIDSAAKQKRFCVGRLDYQDLSDFRQCLVIPTLLV